MKKDTRTDLVAELRKLTPPVHLLEYYAETILEAEAGEYHDYKNRKYDCGKVAVVERLRVLGFKELIKQVINGDYDETADEEDLQLMRASLPKALWKTFGL
jgi:hypothetical protein